MEYIGSIFVGYGMKILGAFVPFVLVLCPLVFFHELGHFWAARFYGVRVDVFSIGFGPELLGWTDKKGTRWKIAPFLLGGYVKMFGDADASSKPDQEKLGQLSDEEKSQTLHSKPPLQKMAISAAGPLANYILAFVLLVIVCFFQGRQDFQPVIGGLAPQENTFAQRAKLMEGDRILSLNNQSVTYFSDIVKILGRTQSPQKNLELYFQRGETKHLISIDTKGVANEKLLGVFPHQQGSVFIPISFIGSIKQSFQDLWSVSWASITAIGGMFVHRDLSNLSGPVQIAMVAKNVLHQGFWSFLSLMALLSISLGLLNLFPIPVLDGGHMVLYGIEALRRKPLSQKLQNWIYIGSGILMMGLMVFVLFSDICKLLGLEL
jgi:regulator of sigma E protease